MTAQACNLRIARRGIVNNPGKQRTRISYYETNLRLRSFELRERGKEIVKDLSSKAPQDPRDSSPERARSSEATSVKKHRTYVIHHWRRR